MHTFLRRVAWIVLAWLLAAPVLQAQTAGTVDPAFGASLSLAGNTKAIASQADGKTIVGGTFPKHIVRLNVDGSYDSSFAASINGNSSFYMQIYAIAVQADGGILIGGQFETANGVARNSLARLNPNGSLDTAFTPATRPGDNIRRIVVQPNGNILLTGTFSKADNSSAQVIRLKPTGSLDTGFQSATIANGGVTSASLQADGKIIIGGYFTQIDSVACNRVARLNADGSFDTSFQIGVGPNQQVNAVQVQSDGKVLIGGFFNSFDNAAYYDIARVNADGSLDTTFLSRADYYVYTITLQSDGKILLGTLDQLQRINPDGSLDTTFNGTGGVYLYVNSGDGVVAAIPQADGKIVALSYIVRRITATGGVDPVFKVDVAPGPNAAIVAHVVQSDGKVIIAGNFTQFSGVPLAPMVRLNVDGSLDSTYNLGINSSGHVNGMLFQPDGKLLIFGYGFSTNGRNLGYFARLNTDGSVDASFDATSWTSQRIGCVPNAICLRDDGKIVIGGNLGVTQDSSRQSFPSIARLNANGTLDATFNGTYVERGTVKAVTLQPDGKILAGGQLIDGNGNYTIGLRRFLADGTQDSTFTPVPVSYLNVSCIDAKTQVNSILFGGFPTFIGGPVVTIFTRVQMDGSADSSFTAVQKSAGAGNVSGFIPLSDGKLFLGGSVDTTTTGAFVHGLARISANGAVDGSFNLDAGPNNAVNAMQKGPDGKIVISGAFTAVNGAVRNYVARLNADGSLDASFNPGVGAPHVVALSLQPTDGKLIVGGTFTAAGGQPANALARLRTDGSLDLTFTAPFAAGDSVPAFARQPKDGKIVASRVLASTAAVPFSATPEGLPPRSQSKVHNPIARLIPGDGSLDTTFYADAGTNGTAYCLGVQTDGKIVAGGNFTQLNLPPESKLPNCSNLGRLNADGTLDTGFAAYTDGNGTVQTVLVQADGKIVVGGIFTQVNGAPRARLARLNGDGTLDAGFSTAAGADKPVVALKQQTDGRLVVGGSFAVVNGAARSCLARLNADGTLDAAFNAGAIALSGGTALVSSVDQQVDGKLVIGGLFDHINGTARPNVARLNPDGSLDTTFDPGTGTDAIVRAVVLQPDGKTLLGGDFSTVGGLERDAAARLLGDYDLNKYPALGQWRIINFGSPDASGKAADTAAPFGDGVANLVKYALNLSPQAADATAMTATGTKGLPLLGKDTGGNYLTLTFVRRAAGTAPGVSYLVEFTNALTNPAGFAVNPSASSAATSLDATWERVTVTDSVPMTTGQQPNRFVRLHITDP